MSYTIEVSKDVFEPITDLVKIGLLRMKRRL